MQKGLNNVMRGLLIVLLVLSANCVFSQSKTLLASQYANEKNYDKAVELYVELYGLSPDSVYRQYLNTLLESKKFKQAEQLVEKQKTLRDNPLMPIDMGDVYEHEGRNAKAREEYDKVIRLINGDVMFTDRIVKAFLDAKKEDYAILAYEKTGKILNAPYYYSMPLATLYAKCGNLDKQLMRCLLLYLGRV
jgi:tetratricopeptide (TPR) repeat protein